MPIRLPTTLRCFSGMLSATLLCACVYLPVVDQQHMQRESCQTVSKKLTLSANNRFSNDLLNGKLCTPRDCDARAIVLALAIPASTAIVSGCIVLLGNTVYWLEYTGRCEENKLEQAKTDFYQSLD